MTSQPLLEDTYLRAQWSDEFKAFEASAESAALHARQPPKNNNRSPVEQCFDYLQSAWQGRDRDSLTEPFFALVTDMNEFRLYVRRLGRGQFQRFVISGPPPLQASLHPLFEITKSNLAE